MRLGKQLIVGFLVSLAALGLYILLARSVAGPGRVTDFDLRVADRLHEHAQASPATVDFFVAVTTLGDGDVLMVVGLSVAVVLLWWRHRLLTLVWLAALAGGAVLNFLLKNLLERPRPTYAGTFSPADGFSFPSGHSMNSLITYGMLAYLLTIGIQTRWLRGLLVAVLGLLVLAIGFSRMYLGNHWLSDVIGGFSAAVIWLTFCIIPLEGVRSRREHMRAIERARHAAE